MLRFLYYKFAVEIEQPPNIYTLYIHCNDIVCTNDTHCINNKYIHIAYIRTDNTYTLSIYHMIGNDQNHTQR